MPAVSVICAYCELGHLFGGGRRETRATNSKLRKEKGDEVRGGKMGDNFSTNVLEYAYTQRHHYEIACYPS